MGKYDNLYVKPLQRASSTWANSVVDALNELYDMASVAVRISKIVKVTANYTANPYELVLVDASGGSVTITLPSVANGVTVIVKKIDTSTNTVTIAPPSGKYVENSSSIELASFGEAVILVADRDGNWWIIARV